MPTEVLQPQVMEATAFKDTHIASIIALLRLGAVIYIPCDVAPPLSFLFDMERVMPGSRWSYYDRHTLHGPTRFYGKCRLRVELEAGSMNIGGLG